MLVEIAHDISNNGIGSDESSDFATRTLNFNVLRTEVQNKTPNDK
jgi:hypothetical protein